MIMTREIVTLGFWLMVLAIPPTAGARDKVGNTFDRSVLPIAQKPFAGHVDLRTSESTLDFPAEASAPQGAPNVLLIMPDDVGFGAASAFGGPIPTPALDRIADAGLRFNQFHTTALCSPMRAALITGRNSHSVSTGVLHGARHRFSQVQHADVEGQRYGSRVPEAERLQHFLVLQE